VQRKDNAPIWGAEQIAPYVGRTPQQTSYLLKTGKIKSARKVGHVWVASPRALMREFGTIEEDEGQS
jgi:hypothetical protein